MTRATIRPAEIGLRTTPETSLPAEIGLRKAAPSGDGAQHPDSAPDDDGTDGARVRQMPTKALATTGDGEVPTAALALTAAASLCCMALARCAKRRSVGSPAR